MKCILPGRRSENSSMHSKDRLYVFSLKVPSFQHRQLRSKTHRVQTEFVFCQDMNMLKIFSTFLLVGHHQISELNCFPSFAFLNICETKPIYIMPNKLKVIFKIYFSLIIVLFFKLVTSSFIQSCWREAREHSLIFFPKGLFFTSRTN